MREAAKFLIHPIFSPGFRRFGWYDTIDWFRLYSHCCILESSAVMIWTPVPYLTIHFFRYHRGAASLCYRNRFEIIVLMSERKPSPLWFSCRCENYAVEWEYSLALLRPKLFDFERWHWSSHVRQTRPWSGVVGIRYFWHFFLPCFCHNFGCKVFFASHESRREKSDLRVLTSEAGH